jgi:hypothetical protein
MRAGADAVATGSDAGFRGFDADSGTYTAVDD